MASTCKALLLQLDLLQCELFEPIEKGTWTIRVWTWIGSALIALTCKEKLIFSFYLLVKEDKSCQFNN